MNAYLAVIRARFLVLLQYRAAALAGVVTQVFWGLVKVMVFAAFFASTTRAQPMDLGQVLAYIWLGQAFLVLLPWNVDDEIAGHVRNGNVAYELLRPLDLYAFWFARTLAFRAAPALLRMTPLLPFAWFGLPLVGLGAWALPMPDSPVSAALFVASLLGSLLLSTTITMLLHISLFWTISGEGVNRLMPGVVLIFSGMVIPLPLFPDLLQGFLHWQPFRGLSDVPFRIYSGHIAPADAGWEILLQLGWVGVLIVAGVWLLRRAGARLVVQGG